MKLRNVLIALVAASMAAVVYAQTNQTSQSNSQSQSGNGKTSSWGQSSSSSSSSGWSSSNSSRNAGGGHSASGKGNGNGSGNGSGFGINGKPTHAILYTLSASQNVGDESGQRTFDQHVKHLGELQAKGKVLIFGPWRDQPGSMAIVLAKSDEEANEIASNDPAVKSGALTFEVRAWNVMTPVAAPAKTRN